ALQKDFEDFRQLVQYGDPLVVVGRYGKGRVVAFLTTAGRSWNYWPGGCPASATYPMVIHELQRYLTSGSEDLNRFVGTPLTLDPLRRHAPPPAPGPQPARAADAPLLPARGD